MKFYLEKNNLQYYTFSSHSEKPIKAVIHHLPPDTSAEDISSSLHRLRLQSYQREAIDNQSKSTKWTNPNPASIPCYINKEPKISRDIQAEEP
jgi:hypothetical protein